MNLNGYFPVSGDFVLGNIILDTTLEEIYLNQQLNQLLLTDQSKTTSEDNSSKIEDLSSKMASLSQKMCVDDFLLNLEFIPWDNRCVVKTAQTREPYLENFFKMQFTHTEGLHNKIKDLTQDLVKGMPNTDISVISSEMRDNISSLIEKLLNEQLKECDESSIEVELYASFISLNRTRSFEPLRIRSNAVLSDKLRDNASRIYIISECLLGGIFFGLHKNVTGAKEKSSFSCQSLQVISKGAISNIVLGDLDASYNNWKMSLMNDPHSGYPISFKVKNFGEIIK